MVSYPYAINIDWLQLYCHDKNFEPLNVKYNGISSYEFKLLPHGSRHFKEIWEVQDTDGDKYCIIQRVPHSSILSSDASIVQLCNRELYKPCFASEFIIFLKAHKFEYKSISRLDICFDSNHLYNGLKHSAFIKKLMLGTYLKNNQAKVKWHFDSIATVGRPMECNSCSFGSQSSPVSTKMYNKTLEMEQVKKKPYIIESWGYNGIDTSQDVWRIEISIKSDATTTIRTTTGEIFRLMPDSLKLQTMVEDIFFSYAEQYFSFKKNNGTKNKSRMPDLVIFPKNRETTLKPRRITTEVDSTRSDRIFIKKLHSLFTSLPNMDNETWYAIWEVSNAFTLSRSLAEWRKMRVLRSETGEEAERNIQTTYLQRIEALFNDLTEYCPHLTEEIHYYLQNIFSLIERESQCS